MDVVEYEPGWYFAGVLRCAFNKVHLEFPFLVDCFFRPSAMPIFRAQSGPRSSFVLVIVGESSTARIMSASQPRATFQFSQLTVTLRALSISLICFWQRQQ